MKDITPTIRLFAREHTTGRETALGEVDFPQEKDPCEIQGLRFTLAPPPSLGEHDLALKFPFQGGCVITLVSVFLRDSLDIPLPGPGVYSTGAQFTSTDATQNAPEDAVTQFAFVQGPGELVFTYAGLSRTLPAPALLHVDLRMAFDDPQDVLNFIRDKNQAAATPDTDCGVESLYTERIKQLEYETHYLRERLSAIENSRTWRTARQIITRMERVPMVSRLKRVVLRKRAKARADALPGLERLPAKFPKLTKPVCVLVPVYNGVDALRALADSLEQTHPNPNPLLLFLFIDDGSPDKGVQELLSSHRFFQRHDVQVEANAQNLGFVRTVNRGIKISPPQSDLILLNADTQVFGHAFAILQDVAERHNQECGLAQVGSVTPLTNNGTIASLFNWPDGGNMPEDLTPEMCAAAVEAARLKTPDQSAPTGVGFCMYMPRLALNIVGDLDAERFGLGYGEENDWCRRGAEQGFQHLICTETFVYHQEAQSFGAEQKQQLLETNMRALLERHPDYMGEVERYVTVDPLSQARERLLQGLGLLPPKHMKSIILVLHNNPDCGFGGTEWHVKWLTRALLIAQLSEGAIHITQVFPETRDGALHVVFRTPGDPNGAPDTETAFPAAECGDITGMVFSAADVLHCHHLRNMPKTVLDAIAHARPQRKIFTAHDFDALCPATNMIGPDKKYCSSPQDIARCNSCLSRILNKDESITAYRERTGEVLRTFDTLLFPSQSARSIFTSVYSGLGNTQEVFPHFLPCADDAKVVRNASAPARDAQRTLVFLGEISDLKGRKLLMEAGPTLQAAGYHLEVWGHASGLPKGLAEIRPYSSWKALPALAAQARPFAVCMPSIWPETFSYTLFEALTLIRRPVVVGPFGNPAEYVTTHNVGAALATVSPQALIDAVQHVEDNVEQLMNNVLRKAPEILSNSTLRGYIERYIAFFEE